MVLEDGTAQNKQPVHLAHLLLQVVTPRIIVDWFVHKLDQLVLGMARLHS